MNLSRELARWDLHVVVPLVIAALFVRLGFLELYANFILHEDSGPYIVEAERLLSGRDTVDGLPGRPIGYPLFLAFIIAFLSPKLIYTIALQHVLSVASALMLTIVLRMMGVNRFFSYVFFVAIAFSHRLMHYDNTIGAETLTVFLISLSLILASGMALRRWNIWVCSSLIGLLLSYALLVRSATIALPIVLSVWVLSAYGRHIVHGAGIRILLAALMVLPVLVTALTVVQWNEKQYGQSTLSRETKPTMAFVIGYSADTTRGSNIEIRRALTPIVNEGRQSEGVYGFYSPEKGNNYQWVFRIFRVFDSEKTGTPEEKDRILSSLFWETLLTPKSLYEHLSHHTLRELKFMLFDSSPNSNSVADPEGYHFFVKRDGANLNIARVRSDYAANEPVLGLPWDITKTAKRLAKRYKAEYQKKPGMMRVYAVLSITLLVFLLYQTLGVGKYVKRATRWIGKDSQIRYTGGLAAPQGIHPAANGIALLVYGIWAGNAIMACFLIYALHRYSYYVLPFIAFTAIYGLYLLYKVIRPRGEQSAPPKPSESGGI